MGCELRIVNEFDLLPQFATVSDLFSANGGGGQCQLLAGSARPASAWYHDCIAEKGGHPVPDWWRDDPEIICNPVQLFHVRNAFYAPAFGAVIADNGAVMEHSVAQARYITSDLTGMPYVTAEGGHPVFKPPSNVPELEAVAVTMPWGAIYNYGHFLCDCLTSVALFDQVPNMRGHGKVFPPLNAWQRRHLELLGVAPVELDQPLYRISDVVFPNGMSYFLNRPNVNYRTLSPAQLRHKRATDVRFEKVYITRSRVTEANHDRRRFLSEQALENEIGARGFQIVAPELCEIDEQIDLFRNARIIVACRGAALANAVYCRPGATIVEIIPVVPGFEGYQWVRDICAIIGCRWRPYFVAGVPPAQPVITAGQIRPNAGFTFEVDIADLISFIERFM